MVSAAIVSFAGWVMRFEGILHIDPCIAKTVFHAFTM
jgi:hypothetical protein